MKDAVLAVGAIALLAFFLLLRLAIVLALPLLAVGALLRYMGYL